MKILYNKQYKNNIFKNKYIKIEIINIFRNIRNKYRNKIFIFKNKYNKIIENIIKQVEISVFELSF